eukprot:UN00852
MHTTIPSINTHILLRRPTQNINAYQLQQTKRQTYICMYTSLSFPLIKKKRNNEK